MLHDEALEHHDKEKWRWRSIWDNHLVDRVVANESKICG